MSKRQDAERKLDGNRRAWARRLEAAEPRHVDRALEGDVEADTSADVDHPIRLS